MQAIPHVTGAAKLDKPESPKLWAAAQSLEASFIAEMLKSAGLGEARQAFGGGVGEQQFSSYITQEYADEMTQAGGIGLAESIYRSLLKGQSE